MRKKIVSFVVHIVVMAISFYAGAAWIHAWWTHPSEDGEFNPVKDEICKKHKMTLIDGDHNVYGETRGVKITKKSIHTMNKIGF